MVYNMSNFKALSKRLASDNIDCAIINSPENFYYLVGMASHQHTVTRQPGLASAVVGGKVAMSNEIFVMDFEQKRFVASDDFVVSAYDTWVGVRTMDELAQTTPLSSQRTKYTIFQKIQTKIKSDQVMSVGVEMDYLTVSAMKQLEAILPDVNFVNISPVLTQMRSIKSNAEVLIFKSLIAKQDYALNETMKMVAVGKSEADVSNYYRNEVFKQGIMPSSWSMFSTGNNSSFLGLPSNAVIKDGDIFKYDGGVNAEMHFYTTDFARSWIIGTIDLELLRLKKRLYDAQRLMISSMKPGLVMSDLFDIGFEYVKKMYPTYERGHLGHSISIGPSTWEAPMISKGVMTELQENMILCVEVPLYIEGIGGFNLEDMVLITCDGAQILSSLTPHFSQAELECLEQL